MNLSINLETESMAFDSDLKTESMVIEVDFEAENMVVDVDFEAESMTIESDFGEVYRLTEYVGGELYQGEYEIVPTVEGQTLETKDRVLIENIKILEIPFYNVSNTAGGSTVYIAKELD